MNEAADKREKVAWVASDCGSFERDPATGTVRTKGLLQVGKRIVTFGGKPWRTVDVTEATGCIEDNLYHGPLV